MFFQLVLHIEDLANAGLAKSRSTLKTLIEDRGFPPGHIIAGRRTWTPREILDWIEAQPTDKKLVPHVHKARLAALDAKRAAALHREAAR
jgi:predicted DNA-binding transcriptional regulator AlpA